MLSNITTHWKTSVAGVLLAIVTITPILEKIDWSHMTTSGYFGLAGALGTALLGLLAKDPGSTT